MPPLADLSERERAVVLECLKCVATGKVIEHDWEFPILFGIEVAELISVLQAWPEVDESDGVEACAINNSMFHLLSYPHGYHTKWDSVMPIPLEEVVNVLRKWQGIPDGTLIEYFM